MRLLLIALSIPAFAQSTLATWTITEPASINHPSQPTCFPYSGGVLRYESNRVLGPSATEVAWQQLRDGSVCIEASLTADASNTYTLQSGSATTVTPSNPVVLSVTTNYLQISNGIAGVKIPTPVGQSVASPAYGLSHVLQLYVNGNWIGDSPYILNGTLNQAVAATNDPIPFCTDASQDITNHGPMVVTIKTTTICNRPAYYYGSLLREAGDGFFSTEITVFAGHRSVLLSYYTDLDVRWALDLSSAYATMPNILAYRNSGATSLACGYYYPDGVTKTSSPGRVNTLQDIGYTKDRYPTSYGTCSDNRPSMNSNYAAVCPSQCGWSVWTINESQSGSYPVIGVFSGRGSKMRWRGSQPNGIGTFADGTMKYYHEVWLRGPDNSWVDYNGAEFGYYWGPQSSFPATTQHTVVPPVQVEMNALAGPLTLTKIYANMRGYSDPAGGWVWPYLPESTMSAYVNRVNTDTAYYNALAASGAGTEGTRFINWARLQDATARAALLDGGTEIKSAIGEWVNGDGRFTDNHHYYQGIYPFVRNIDNFIAVLKDASSSDAQKAEAKGWLGLGVAMANDSDYFNFDLDPTPPDGLGNPNQVYQYNVFRALLSLVINSHPAVSQFVLSRSIEAIDPLLSAYWNSSGSGKASTHYQSNYAEPAVGLLNAGIKGGNAVASGRGSLLSSINWDLSSLTPPEPRFNGKRKSYSNGDGNTEANARLGLLGTVFNGVDSTLSQKAIWAWRSQDGASRYTHSSFYFPTVALIDDQITQTDPAIGSMYLSGYHAALRARWETANETVAWFIHGGWYSDHKHRDNGQVSVYAHKAPLVIDWNANLYSPQTAGGYMHSRAIRESELSDAWDGTMTSYGIPDNEWGAAASIEFGKFNYGSFSRSTFGSTWTRDVRLMSHAASYPILIVRDSFSGADASVSKLVSWMQMATGAVTVNGSGVTPTTRNYDSGQFPSCTAGAALSTGLNRLQFTGQTWTQHATSGIDWDTYINVGAAASYCLGNWSHIEHASREMSEYLAANGSSFRERQHILRVKTSDAALETIMLPWRKGESTTFTVTNQACGTQIIRGTHTLCSSADSVTWTDGADSSLMSTGTASVSYAGMTISGGPAELRTSGSIYIATIDGLSAQSRTITLPSGTWYPNGAAVIVAGNQFRLFHDGATGQGRAVTFSGTPSGSSLHLGFAPPSGATQIRIYIDDVAVAQEACAAACSVDLQLPNGTFNLKHAWVNSGGSVILTSTNRFITI